MENNQESAQKKKTRPPTAKEIAFVDLYFIHKMNQTRAYLALYPKSSEHAARANATRLIAKDSVRALIEARLAESHMSADRALQIIEQQADATLGDFYKIVEEWTFYPLPTADIIDQKEVDVLDDEGKPTGEKRISYWVRRVAIDTYKLIDPRYSHLVKKFSDSPKNGMTIELHDKQNAARDILKIHGRFSDSNISLELDLSTLTNDQLERLAKGENVYSVLADKGTS